MSAPVQSLHASGKRRARGLLLASTTLYLLVASAILVFSLVRDIEVPLPSPDWSLLAQAAFFTAFSFPAISVLSLLAGWVAYASASYTGAWVGALVPWAWGLMAIISTSTHLAG